MCPRPYKMKNPKETIKIAKTILQNYGISVAEKRWFNPHPELYSVLIETDAEFGCFRTSGKGVTRELALASAYAEFLERLQNGLITDTPFSRANLSKIRKNLGFYYFNDESVLKKSDFNRLPVMIRSDLLGGDTEGFKTANYYKRLGENDSIGPVSLPFKDMSTGKTINIPYNLLIGLTGSNGMCAGNTAAEAIYQGVCELIERYAASYLFFQKCCPPTISRDTLCAFPNELRIIDDIEQRSGFKVIVKSFETPYRLPVLGAILLDEKKKIYRLNVGCDKSFQIALRRCLTEIYQGIADDESMRNVMLPIPDIEASWSCNDDEISVHRRRQEFTKFCINGSGVFPTALFADEAHYPFSMKSFGELDSFEAEVDDLLLKIQQIGSTVYVHDSSYMGFPAYWVYIPGFLLVGNYRNEDLPINDIGGAVSIDRVEDILFSKLDSSGSRTMLASFLQGVSEDSTFQTISRIETFKGVWEKIPISFLLVLLWNSVGRFSEAQFYLDKFKKQYPLSEQYDFLDQLIGDQETSNDSLRFVRLPSCPNCSECALENDCKISGKLRLYERALMAH